MIARSGYEWVDGDLDKIVINGKIMPLRSDTGTGLNARKCLRGEDIAWLLERYEEADRMSDQFMSDPFAAHHFTREMRASQIREIRRLATNMATYGHFFKANPFDALVDKTVSSAAPPLNDLFPELITQVGDITAPSVERGDLVRQSDIMKFFADDNLFYRCWVMSRAGHPMALDWPAWTVDDFDAVHDVWYVQTSADNFFAHQYEPTFDPPRYSTLTLKAGKRSGWNLRYAHEDVTIYAVIHVREIDRNEEVHHYLFKRVSSNIDTSGHFVWWDNLRSKIDSILSELGITIRTSGSGFQFVSIGATALYAVCHMRDKFSY